MFSLLFAAAIPLNTRIEQEIERFSQCYIQNIPEKKQESFHRLLHMIRTSNPAEEYINIRPFFAMNLDLTEKRNLIETLEHVVNDTNIALDYLRDLSCSLSTSPFSPEDLLPITNLVIEKLKKQYVKIKQIIIEKINQAGSRLQDVAPFLTSQGIPDELRQAARAVFMEKIEAAEFGELCDCLAMDDLNPDIKQLLIPKIIGKMPQPETNLCDIAWLLNSPSPSIPEELKQLTKAVFIERVETAEFIKLCNILGVDDLNPDIKKLFIPKFIEKVSQPETSLCDIAWLFNCPFVPEDIQQLAKTVFIERIKTDNLDEFCPILSMPGVNPDIKQWLIPKIIEKIRDPENSALDISFLLTDEDLDETIKSVIIEKINLPEVPVMDIVQILDGIELSDADKILILEILISKIDTSDADIRGLYRIAVYLIQLLEDPDTCEEIKQLIEPKCGTLRQIVFEKCDELLILELIEHRFLEKGSNLAQLKEKLNNPNTPMMFLITTITFPMLSQELLETVRALILDRAALPTTPIQEIVSLLNLKGIDDGMIQNIRYKLEERKDEIRSDMLLTVDYLSAGTIYTLLPEDQKEQGLNLIFDALEKARDRKMIEEALKITQDKVLLSEELTRRAAEILQCSVLQIDPEEFEVHGIVRPIWDKFIDRLTTIGATLPRLPFEESLTELKRHIDELEQSTRDQAQAALKELENSIHLWEDFHIILPNIVAILNDDHQNWIEDHRNERWNYYLLNSFSAAGEAYGAGRMSCTEGILERAAGGFWGLHTELDLQKLNEILFQTREKLEHFMHSLQNNKLFLRLSVEEKTLRLAQYLQNFKKLYNIDQVEWNGLLDMKTIKDNLEYLKTLEDEENVEPI